MEMVKIYRKGQGAKTKKSKSLCKQHFISKYGREPSIQDVASVGYCDECFESVMECEALG